MIDRRAFLARVWSNRELNKVANLFKGDVVNISAWEDSDKEGRFYKDYFINAGNYYYSNYAGDRGIQNRENEFFLDLTADLPEEYLKRFDVTFNHTTLEHIFNVDKAFENICRMSKDIAIIVVPFVQMQHEGENWQDFWRFTPSCIKELFRKNGMELVYQSTNYDRNSANYIFSIGSYYPEKWKRLLPQNDEIHNAGYWVGESILYRLKNKVKKLLLKG